MADTFTTNLNLTKPEPGAAEDTWGISLNADLDALDAIFSSSGTQINLNPNQVNFGDNKKAVFGAGNDLQIYHDGNHSRIVESGSGDMIIQGDEFSLMNVAGTEYMIFADNDSFVKLYYDGSNKLATTSTGIDVTGTATMDGLTIQGDNSATPLTVKGGTGSIASIDLLGGTNATDNSSIRSKYSLYLTCNSTNAISNRSIIFGNGTSEFARIDASGKLGLGTSSPSSYLFGDLAVTNGTSAGITLASTTNSIGTLAFADGTSGNSAYRGFVQYNHASDSLSLGTYGATALTIDSNKNVGIGTSSPASKLSIENTGSSTVDAITLDWEHLSTTTNIEQRIQWRFGDDATADTFLNAGYIGSGKQGSWQSGSERDSYLSFGTTNDNTQTEAMRISADGSVGIGTTSPTPFLANSKTLEISDDSGVGSELILTNNSAMSANEIVGSLIFKNTDSSGNPNHFAGLRARAESTFGRMDLEFYAGRSRMEGGTPDMVIIPNGADAQANVGIGTTSPSAKLHVSGSSSNVEAKIESTNDNAILRISADSGGTGFGGNKK